MVEALWSLGEVARRIGIPPYRLAYAITCGKLPDSKIRLAGRRAFSEAEVQQFAEHFARLPPAKKVGQT